MINEYLCAISHQQKGTTHLLDARLLNKMVNFNDKIVNGLLTNVGGDFMRQGRPRNSAGRDDTLFGDALKKLLRQKGINQASLADQSGVSAETLSRMIHGQRLNGTSTRFHLRNIARALSHFGLLHTVEEVNHLITKIPTMKELDMRDKDDLKLIQELEEKASKEICIAPNQKNLVLTQRDHKDLTTLEDIAWAFYVELTTRIAIQPLAPGHGLLREALNSLYTLFTEMRKILRDAGSHVAANGEESLGFTAIGLLNKGIRPFTTKWHPLLLAYEKIRPTEVSEYEHEQQWKQAEEMRRDLAKLQAELELYAETFASIARIKHTKISRS